MVRKQIWLTGDSIPTTASHLSSGTNSHSFTSVSEYLMASMTRSTGSGYYYVDLTSISDYTIQTGDYIEYDVYWETANCLIAIDLTTSAGTLRDTNGQLDQNGLSPHPSTNINTQAFGQWYHRKISLSGLVGGIIANYDIVTEWDGGATTLVARFKNIAITDGNGVSTIKKYVGKNYNTQIKKASGVAIADIRSINGVGQTRASWYNASWSHRTKITVMSDKVSGTPTNFPVYVDLSQMGTDFFGTVNSDGSDIRVTTSDGTTEVPREVVGIDVFGGNTGELHFKAPSLSSTQNTNFYIYWGNGVATEPAVSDTYGANNAWRSEYKMVHHMEQVPTTAQNESTTNNNDLVYQGTWNSSRSITGQVGKGVYLDAGVGNHLTAPDSASLDIGGSFSLSTWVRPVSTMGGNVPLMIKQGESGGMHNYYFDFNSSNQLFVGYYNGSTWIESSRTSTLSTGSWYLAHAVYDMANSTTKIYLNGAQAVSDGSKTGTPRVGTGQLVIGVESFYLYAYLDEMRIYSGVLDANWIATEYNNQSSPLTFAVASPAEVQ